MHETPITESIVAANPNLKGFGLSRAEEGIHDVAACEKAGIVRLLCAISRKGYRVIDGSPLDHDRYHGIC